MNIVEKYKQEIKDIESSIASIQTLCSHPEEAVTKVHKGSTGNPYEANEYWTNFHCELCDKRWTLDGSH